MNDAVVAQSAADYFSQRRGKLSLWIGVLAGPLAWAAQLQIGYALCRFTCAHHWLAPFHHATSLGLLAVALAAGAIAFHDWRLLGGGQSASADEGVIGRSRFMAILGMLSSALFALVIFCQWLPNLFIDPCIY